MSIMMSFKGSIGIQNQIIALLHGSTSLLVLSLIMLATKWELDKGKMVPYSPFLLLREEEPSKRPIVGPFNRLH